MTDVKLPILYDLVPRKGEHLPFFSPHTLKARLALAHKRVDFITEEVTYNDLRHTLAGKLGVAKATAPILELPSGELIMDSYKIADYLEQAYPNQPSLFYPGTTAPVDAQSPQAKMAKAYLNLFAAGMGDSDSQWSPIWELSAAGLGSQMDRTGGDDSVHAYFNSDAKQGAGEPARLAGLDRAELTRHAKASLGPIEATLQVSPWLAGDDASLTDFILYGRYMMHASADYANADEVWKGWPKVADWLARLEAKYAYSSEWRDALDRLKGAAR